MYLMKAIRVTLLVVTVLGLFSISINAQDEGSRPRRVTEDSTGVENSTDQTKNEQRTGVSVTRKRRHGVVRRGAESTAKTTAKAGSAIGNTVADGATGGAKLAADGAKLTAKGASAAGKGTAKGATVAGKSTAKSAKVAGKSTKKAGKAVVDAFK